MGSLHLNIHLEDRHHFLVLLKFFKILITNFINSSTPIFNVYYILECLRLHVRRDLVHNIHHIATYISYYEYVISLKMAFMAETWCWWLLINKAVFGLDLHLFYLRVRFWFVTVGHKYLNVSRPDSSHSKFQISCPFATSQFVLNNQRSCVPFRKMLIFTVMNFFAPRCRTTRHSFLVWDVGFKPGQDHIQCRSLVRAVLKRDSRYRKMQTVNILLVSTEE